MSMKRSREAASSTANKTGNESSDDEVGMPLIDFEGATQGLFEAQERIKKDGRGHVIPARDAVVTWCKENDKTEVTVTILERLAAAKLIKGMPRLHKTNTDAYGRKADGSVLKSFKELLKAGGV